MTYRPPVTPKQRVRRSPEQTIQRAIVRYLRSVLPHGFLVQSTANKPRSAIAGAIEKSMGAIKGWPDLAIYGQDEEWHESPGGSEYCREVAKVWFVEVKAEKGRLSPEQRDLHDKLADIGFAVEVVHSIDEVREFLRRHAIPNREATQ